MTQITKTLSIAGIIAIVTAPAMAEIASTQYVQNALSGIASSIPGLQLGYEDDDSGAWISTILGTDATAPEYNSFAIRGTVGDNGGLAIGLGAYSNGGHAIGISTNAGNDSSLAVGPYASASGDNAIALGPWPTVAGSGAIAIGFEASASNSLSIGIGFQAGATANNAIQLGQGYNSTANSFAVGLGERKSNSNDMISYPLLVAGGTIPYERFAPEIPNTCKAANGQKCALVITWDSTKNKFTQAWEVVRSTSSGQ